MDNTVAPAVIPRGWFDRGHAAFLRSFPQAAAKIPYSPFYLCPLCLGAASEDHLRAGWLSREDVPPKSVGGRKIVLTCKGCNNTAGHEMDDDLRREADLIAFLTKQAAQMPATVRTSSGRMPVQLRVSESGIEMIGVDNATHPDNVSNAKADFTHASEGENWKDFTFNVEFEPYSPERAATAWLRSAYLAFFTAFGYRFIFRSELDAVRQRIKNPASKDHFPFRVIHPRECSAEPILMRIDEPAPFKSYLMVFGRNLVFLPRYGDADLYNRLADQPAGDVKFHGTLYGWPTRPLFLHDRAQP